MNDSLPLRFGKGVRFRRDRDGNGLLLVPESALQFNGSAGAAVELIDGSRTLDDIVDVLVERFEVTRDAALTDVRAVFERLIARGFLFESSE
jgi:pyrroloquinoline quinone biosynthesis protein D